MADRFLEGLAIVASSDFMTFICYCIMPNVCDNLLNNVHIVFKIYAEYPIRDNQFNIQCYISAQSINNKLTLNRHKIVNSYMMSGVRRASYCSSSLTQCVICKAIFARLAVLRGCLPTFNTLWFIKTAANWMRWLTNFQLTYYLTIWWKYAQIVGRYRRLAVFNDVWSHMHVKLCEHHR